MSEQPTPGPWDWDQGDIGQDYSVPYCTVFTKDDDFCICEVNDRISKEQGAINAAFIAAAPETAAERDGLKEINAEMREALRGVLRTLAMGPLDVAAEYGPDMHPDYPVQQAALVAEAALAKAEGKES